MTQKNGTDASHNYTVLQAHLRQIDNKNRQQNGMKQITVTVRLLNDRIQRLRTILYTLVYSIIAILMD